MNRVRTILSISPDERAVVFSSWQDALAIASHALTANGISHVRSKSGGAKGLQQAVREFLDGVERDKARLLVLSGRGEADQRPPEPAKQDDGVAARGALLRARGSTAPLPCSSPSDPAPRILLLLTSQGSNGLNLTAARHVIFLEPLLDPGVEAQATGRVDRFGQTKETFVHRLVIRGSVEENLRRLAHARAEARARGRGALAEAAAALPGADERQHLTPRDVAQMLALPARDE